MRILRWIGFTVIASLSACNCSHHGSQPQIVSKDSTPTVDPDPLAFGDVPLGQSKTLPLKLTNTGSIELDISSVAITQAGGDAGTSQFAFTPWTHVPFGASLQPGDSATANVVCTPNQGGNQTGSLVIKSNSEAIPSLSVALTCNGIDVSIVANPTALDFGDVQDGTTKTLPVTLTNVGSSSSSLIQVSPPTGTQAALFAFTGTPTALAPNQSFTLQVTFSPLQQGPASANLPFSYCATCSTQAVSLTGNGVDGQLVYSPNPINFSNVPAGNSVTSPTVTLTNVGTADVSIDPFAMASGLSTPFSLSGFPPLPTTLTKAGGSFTFTVGYTASAAGNDMDAVQATWVPLDSTGSPVVGISPRVAQDPVNGNGTQNPCTLQIQPASLAFGNVTVGTAAQKSVTLTNSGEQQCNLSGIGLGAGTDAAFTLVAAGTTTLTIAPGANASIAVSCDVPNSNNPLLHKGALTFQSNDPAQANVSVPLTASVQGMGPYSNGWPKWHNDNTDQGQSSADTSADTGVLQWKFSVGVPQTLPGNAGTANPNPTYMNSPVVDAAGNVYQLGMDGTFYAVGPTGTQLWKTPLLAPNPDEHPATPIIAADGTIYVETGTDNPNDTALMYHLDATSGSILFQAGPPSGPRCDPTPDCFSASDCQQIVSSTTTCPGGSQKNFTLGTCCNTADGFDVNPSLGADGLLFDGDDIGQIVTYTQAAGGGFTQANEVVLQTYGERVAVALDGNDNSYWCSLIFCYGISSPAAGFAQMAGWPAAGAQIGGAGGSGLQNGTSWVNSDLAYDASFTGWLMVEAGTQTSKGTGNIEVVAMDPTNGSIKWDKALPSGPTPGTFNPNTGVGVLGADVGNSAPAIDAVDGTVYVGNVNGLYALVGQSGAIKSGFPYIPSQDTGANADVDSAPAIGGDRTVFFGTAGGTFYAVNPDGSERYHLKTGGRISSSPAIGPDGTVFFVSDDGNLYAVR